MRHDDSHHDRNTTRRDDCDRDTHAVQRPRRRHHTRRKDGDGDPHAA
jgi:hypothetical protein